MPLCDRCRVHARLRKLENLIPAVEFQHPLFAGDLTKRHEKHEHECRAADVRVPRMKGDLVRRESDSPTMRHDLQLDRRIGARPAQGDKAIRDAKPDPRFNPGNKAV